MSCFSSSFLLSSSSFLLSSSFFLPSFLLILLFSSSSFSFSSSSSDLCAYIFISFERRRIIIFLSFKSPDCANGTFVDVDGSCTACAAGFYCATPTSAIATCPRQNYCIRGSVAPTPCAAGTYAPQLGSASCSCDDNLMLRVNATTEIFTSVPCQSSDAASRVIWSSLASSNFSDPLNWNLQRQPCAAETVVLPPISLPTATTATMSTTTAAAAAGATAAMVATSYAVQLQQNLSAAGLLMGSNTLLEFTGANVLVQFTAPTNMTVCCEWKLFIFFVKDKDVLTLL